MFDTIGHSLHCRNAYKTTQYLSGITETANADTGEITTRGYLDNMRVKIRGEHLSAVGSLPKYYFGDNLQQLTRKDTQQAIEKLSDSIHIDINSSRVFRLDVGINLIMDHNLKSYYACLSGLRYFKRSEVDSNNALLFVNQKRTLEFYDKLRELKKKKQPIPEIFKNRNVLRYEIHFTKRLKDTFKQEVITKDLSNEDFYINAIDLWQDHYSKISKKRMLRIKPEEIKVMNAKSIFNQLALRGLKNIGETEVLAMIEVQRNEFSKMQYKRIKDKIKELGTLPEFTEHDESIQELDSKIKRASMYYR